MYCRFCGARLPGDSAYCHRCGKAQGESRGGFNWWWLLLIFLGPLGWLALLAILFVTAVQEMRPRTRLAIGGFIFPPLWAPLIWALKMPPWAKGGVIAALVAANTFWLHHLTGNWTVPFVALVVTVILGVMWMTRSAPEADRYLAGIRLEIEDDLDACHALIAGIEDELSLHPLQESSPFQRRYAHALELRSEAAELLRTAASEEDLIVADRRVGRALSGLEGLWDDLRALAGPKL